MVTLCTTQDVLDRCGVNANSVIMASSAIIDRYIETAEGVLIAATRIDYINGVSTTNAYVKEAVKSCVASHAAKQIIMQDMSGYISRAAAITMLNVNEAEFRGRLKDLQNLDTNKIRSIQT